jgi:hypothetical protein
MTIPQTGRSFNFAACSANLFGMKPYPLPAAGRFLMATIGFLGGLYCAVSFAGEKEWSKDAPGAGLSTMEILEVAVEISSPPYVEPEKLRLFRDPSSRKPVASYSGLKVMGQPGPDGANRVFSMAQPARKPLEEKAFQEFFDDLRRDTSWYAPKPAEPGAFDPYHYKLTLKLRDLSTGGAPRELTVEAWYFGQKSRDRFHAIIRKAGQLCGRRDGLEIIHYD